MAEVEPTSPQSGNEVKDLIVQTFKKFDQNGDGVISREELGKVLGLISGKKLGTDDIGQLMDVIDTNRDGKIQYEEFVHWVMQDAEDPVERKLIKAKTMMGGDVDLNYRAFLPERFAVDVASRYALDKLQLGEGGFGKVFVACDKEFGDRKVAVKKVTKTGKGAPSESLQKEIDVMKELDHPNICKLLATFEQGQHMFFVMELCEGGEVFDRIIDAGFISEAMCRDIISQVVAALAYAHGRGIAHRDIKPENIVFCSHNADDTTVKLIDWGLAMSFLGCELKSAVGSFTYAAPEVVLSRNIKAYTQACDLWSMGVLTYVMLSGKPPFWGTEQQHLRNAKSEKYPMSGSPWNSISAEGKDFIRKLLKAKPEERMPITECSQHPWLTSMKQDLSESINSKEVLQNLTTFSHGNTFARMCITAVARQMDNHQLKDIHKTFRALDANGDGVLSIDEIRNGFAKMFGEDSDEVKNALEVFENLDIDGSHFIDYTEFCAAGLGQKLAMQDDIMWAAFNSFDVDNSGTVCIADLAKILDVADIRDAWSPEVCTSMAKELMGKIDADKDGTLSFEDWKAMMRDHWEGAKSQETDKTEKVMDSLGLNAYSILLKVNDLPVEVAEVDT